MKSTAISLRLPPELYEAAAKRAQAAGKTLPLWVRSLIERETGVEADVKRGFASMSKPKLAKLSKAAVKKRHAK